MKFEHTETDLPLENEYPKLVRDRIPEIIKENDGIDVSVRVLSDDDEYLRYLLKKVVEESQELSEARTASNLVEEIADVNEVIQAIMKLKRLSPEDVAQVQADKADKRGSFDQRLLMLAKK